MTGDNALRKERLLRFGALLVFVFFAAGCLPAGDQPSKFYLLRSMDDAAPPSASRNLALGVGPLQLPPYLDRPQIVTQTAGNELRLSEFHRWAEPLKENFTRVLANNLTGLLSTDRVFVFPWGRSVSVDYQVKVEVTRFIGQLGGTSFLTARWSIFGQEGQKLLLTRGTQLSTPTEAATYDALVAAMNRGLTDLSREIASAILSLNRG